MDRVKPWRAPNQYGAAERFVARLLARSPRLKAWVKNAYVHTAYLLSGGTESAYTAESRPGEIGEAGAQTFFGYYDKTPLSRAGWLLCHSARHPSTRAPLAGDTIAVQVYDFQARRYAKPILSIRTRAYNWQQGSRAHWLTEDLFIFNDYDAFRQRYVSRVYSVAAGKELRRYPLPVQDSWRQEYFLSINYQRLAALRPEYGYSNLQPLDDAGLRALDEDGIWRVEQHDGNTHLLYSLAEICRVEPCDEFQEARHKVNHVMIGPDGRQFIFLHRYFVGQQKRDRLFVAASDGSMLRLLAAHGMVSHCYWVNSTTLVTYLRGPSGRDGYYLVDTASGQMTSLFAGALDGLGDGHPHVCGHSLITDTYPDKRRMQHLLCADLRTGTIRELGRFHHSFAYGGTTRCDLHPRVAPDGRHVFFDSVCSGSRRLHFLELA